MKLCVESDRRGREAGYTMVMLVIIIAVMSISMGVAVQTAEFQMRREREAELIFRGKQFIEAIRLYKIKYGRYPMQLKEIYEAKPRVIRKKWKDPITDSEDWGIIFLGQQGRQIGRQGRQLVGPGGPQNAFDAEGRPLGSQSPAGPGAALIGTQTPGGNRQPGQAGGRNQPGDRPGGAAGRPGRSPGDQTGLGDVPADRKMGPIIGVHSTSCDEAIKVYEGHTTYCEWQFIFRERPQPGSNRRRGKVPGGPPVGWHPGDQLGQDQDGNPIKVPPGGEGGPPPPQPTIPRP